MIAAYLFVFVIGLCWGSFLNVVAHRLVANKKFFTCRSHCPSCEQVIRWYDNIPVVSWFLLCRKCRSCKAPISVLYPLTEVSTAIIMTALFHTTFQKPYQLMTLTNVTLSSDAWFSHYVSFGAYAVFFSALIAATRTDFESLLIPQLFTFGLVPFGISCAFLNIISISPFESISGAILGYGILWTIAWFFKRMTHKDGMGIGDMEFLAMIGSFVGPLGTWASLLIASLVGLLSGAAYLLLSGKTRDTRIPFGPFLALGATIYFFFYPVLLRFLWSY